MLKATRPAAPAMTPGETFPDRLLAAASRHPGGTALIEADVHLTHGDVLDRALRVAAGLRAIGVEPGDRVVTQLPNWWEAVVASWAVFLAGGVLVPIVPIYRSRESRFVLGQVDARAVITPSRYRGHDHANTMLEALADLGSSAPVVSVRGPADDRLRFEDLMACPAQESLPRTALADDIAVVLYTSGTTADPKGVLHSHRTLLAEIRGVAAHCRLQREELRVFMASPLSHITGLCYGILLPVDLGGSTVLQDRWDADEAVGIIEGAACTFTVSATPFLAGLADRYAARGQQSNLHTFVCGGADIPADLVLRAHRVLGTTVLRTYGSTELPTSTMADPDADPDVQAANEGLPTRGNKIEIRPDRSGAGELVVRGPELFLGYLDPALNESAFDPDGFFRTGDLASIGADGRLAITGRIKDIINRGGEKFSAAEVEAVLSHLPGVRDVAVVGCPDPLLVERACACLVVEGDAPTIEQLRAAVVAAGLAIQKAPEQLLVLDELPRTASGKIQRFLLRDRATAAVLGSGVGGP